MCSTIWANGSYMERSDNFSHIRTSWVSIE
jgi:hypothetical protein